MLINFPIAVQVRIEKLIVNETLSKGQIIQSDSLAASLGTTSEAVKMVLMASHRKGLVKQFGQDKFEILGVAKPTIDSVFQHTAKSGLSPTSIVRGITVEPASAIVADRLKMKVGYPVYRQVRTRQVQGEAIANQCNYIPFEVCPGLESVDLSQTSFQATLEQQFLAIINSLEETFGLIPATAEDSQILNISPQAPILNVRRLSFSVNQEPLVWADIHIRTDRYAHVAQLWPQAATLLEKG